jgi:hypothetical protein
MGLFFTPREIIRTLSTLSTVCQRARRDVKLWFEIQKRKGDSIMKRVLATGVLGLFLLDLTLAANLFKFTIADVSYPDGRVGTIQASVRINPRSAITVCGYYSSPNDQYLGQFQGTDNLSTDAVVVESYCLNHFGDRTPQN